MDKEKDLCVIIMNSGAPVFATEDNVDNIVHDIIKFEEVEWIRVYKITDVVRTYIRRFADS